MKTLLETVQGYKKILEAEVAGSGGLMSPFNQTADISEPNHAKNELKKSIEEVKKFHQKIKKLEHAGTKLNAEKVAIKLHLILTNLEEVLEKF